MDFLLDFILHIDQYMVMIVRDYHAWAYAILFIIIFCETGLVVTPFLPGILYSLLQELSLRYQICLSTYIYLSSYYLSLPY